MCNNYIKYIKENGKITNRQQLKKVPKLGDKAFEQCAGFLRVPDSDNILDNTGEISYTRLVEKNPTCRAYLYEMDHMTQSKKDKVKDCSYIELFSDHNSLDNPYYSAEGVEVYV